MSSSLQASFSLKSPHLYFLPVLVFVLCLGVCCVDYYNFAFQILLQSSYFSVFTLSILVFRSFGLGLLNRGSLRAPALSLRPVLN